MTDHGAAGFNPPPVSETKAAFLQKYPRPLPGIYDTVIQELLVQQHLLRFQKKYQYDKVPPTCFLSRRLLLPQGSMASWSCLRCVARRKVEFRLCNSELPMPCARLCHHQHLDPLGLPESDSRLVLAVEQQ